jgi:hypothetical protein
MACDITNGRDLQDCRVQMAGIKTVFFFRHSLVTNVTKNGAGEVTGFGNGTIYRFEQNVTEGTLTQEVVRGQDFSQYVRFTVEMTMFYDKREYMEVINYLKSGRWAIFCLDNQNEIRMLGETTGMQETQGIGQSGKTAGDLLYTNLTFEGLSNDLAPFLENFTDYPFDNFPVAVTPPYVPSDSFISINASDKLAIDNLGNRLLYG